MVKGVLGSKARLVLILVLVVLMGHERFFAMV